MRKQPLAVLALCTMASVSPAFSFENVSVIADWSNGSLDLEKPVGDAITKKMATMFAKHLTEGSKAFDYQDREAQLAAGSKNMRPAKLMIVGTLTVLRQSKQADEAMRKVIGEAAEKLAKAAPGETVTATSDVINPPDPSATDSKINIDIRVVAVETREIVTMVHSEVEQSTALDIPTKADKVLQKGFEKTPLALELDKVATKAAKELQAMAADKTSALSEFLAAEEGAPQQ